MKNFRVVGVLLVVMLVAVLIAAWKGVTIPFSRVTTPEPTLAVPARAECGRVTDDDYYFPVGLLSPVQPALDLKARSDLSVFPRTMREPSLSCGPAMGETYRLLRLEWTGAPLSIRVTRMNSEITMSVLELKGPGWEHFDDITRRTEEPLTAVQWEALTESLRSLGFWQSQTYERWDGEDGSPWFLEGRRGDVYHVVQRISPKDGPFRDAARVFFTLAGIPDERR